MAAASSNVEPLGFMDFPPEVRATIYKHAFHGSEIFVAWVSAFDDPVNVDVEDIFSDFKIFFDEAILQNFLRHFTQTSDEREVTPEYSDTEPDGYPYRQQDYFAAYLERKAYEEPDKDTIEDIFNDSIAIFTEDIDEHDGDSLMVTARRGGFRIEWNKSKLLNFCRTNKKIYSESQARLAAATTLIFEDKRSGAAAAIISPKFREHTRTVICGSFQLSIDLQESASWGSFRNIQKLQLELFSRPFTKIGDIAEAEIDEAIIRDVRTDDGIITHGYSRLKGLFNHETGTELAADPQHRHICSCCSQYPQPKMVIRLWYIDVSNFEYNVPSLHPGWDVEVQVGPGPWKVHRKSRVIFQNVEPKHKRMMCWDYAETHADWWIVSHRLKRRDLRKMKQWI